MCYLHLSAGSFELPALVTRSSAEQLEIHSGDTLYAVVKSSHVRIVNEPACAGSY
ncbi:MAG: TOBE domain-containing protein [Syntrophales bacterium]|nr:TOBE domain-containing protein [Syntrophales bacterium]